MCTIYEYIIWEPSMNSVTPAHAVVKRGYDRLRNTPGVLHFVAHVSPVEPEAGTNLAELHLRSKPRWARWLRVTPHKPEMAEPCEEDRGGFEEGEPPPIVT